ncbi:hypothetical protein ScPMuIL_012869 [Solemya velum]
MLVFREALTLWCLLCWAGRGVWADHVVPAVHYSCGHQPPKAEEVIHDVYIEPAHLINKRSADQRLRIHLHYDISIQYLPRRHREIIEEHVRRAVYFWEDTLKVKATQAVIRLNRQCISPGVRYNNQHRYCIDGCAATTTCGDIVIPETHLQRCSYWDSRDNSFGTSGNYGPGVSDKDFILYVAALDSARCQQAKTIAYAAHCQQEKALDRPIAGYFSICPNSITTSMHDQKQLLSTIKHEILHALGFTAGLYAFYRDDRGNPLTPRNKLTNKPRYNKQSGLYEWSDQVVREVLRHNWRYRQETTTRKVSMIVTQRVVKEVREHFSCMGLEGAELEDQGIDGTALTHWEKRLFENEAMTGTYTQNPVISRVTLALMEDTGWYSANYKKAEELEWGQNLGCDFVKKSCYEWIYSRQQRGEDIHPFCTDIKRGRLHTDCTNNRHAVALCNLVEYTAPLPPKYQYFRKIHNVPVSKVPRFGGSVSLADYCPYLQEFSWKEGDTVVRGSHCLSRENNIDTEYNYFGERYGNTSRCFNQGRPWVLKRCGHSMQPDHSGSGCYQTACSRTEGLLVNIGGEWKRCYHAGYSIPVTYVSYNYHHSGTLICPACQEICPDVTCPRDVPAPRSLPTPYLEAPCSRTNSIFDTPFLQILCSVNVANFLYFMIVIFICHR